MPKGGKIAEMYKLSFGIETDNTLCLTLADAGGVLKHSCCLIVSPLPLQISKLFFPKLFSSTEIDLVKAEDDREDGEDNVEATEA